MSQTELSFAPDTADAVPVIVLDTPGFDDWLAKQPGTVQTWVTAQGFRPTAGAALILPGADGQIDQVLAGLGDPTKPSRKRFALAEVAAKLPEGTYKLQGLSDPNALAEAALGWLLAGYKFNRYAGSARPDVRLVAPAGLDAARILAIAQGECLTRDLINTPSNDMGPAEIEAAARDLAETHSAQITVIEGAALLDQNFPMIHAVGRASTRAPRLIDMRWGETGPQLTLVGKGVAFDTGGLNLKPGASMGLMKKDMGGSAATLGLAHMIMAIGLKLRLRVLIPAVENAVSGNAFRPGDILTARNGKTVEINNTDAEGRLVLADALALAAEESPDLIVSMATLTGAARVAVGPDLAPFFCDDEGFVAALASSSAAVRDPVWRMPFHTPYEDMIEPGIADLDNAPSGGFGGAITAALFLRRFTADLPYAHFDIYGWQPSPKPARPKGGVGQGTRALLDALPAILDL